MATSVIYNHGKFRVWDDYTGFCPISEKRLNQVVRKYRMRVRIKKRPRCAILTKGKKSITFDSPEDLAAKILDIQDSPARRRKLFTREAK